MSEVVDPKDLFVPKELAPVRKLSNKYSKGMPTTYTVAPPKPFNAFAPGWLNASIRRASVAQVPNEIDKAALRALNRQKLYDDAKDLKYHSVWKDYAKYRNEINEPVTEEELNRMSGLIGSPKAIPVFEVAGLDNAYASSYRWGNNTGKTGPLIRDWVQKWQKNNAGVRQIAGAPRGEDNFRSAQTGYYPYVRLGTKSDPKSNALSYNDFYTAAHEFGHVARTVANPSAPAGRSFEEIPKKYTVGSFYIPDYNTIPRKTGDPEQDRLNSLKYYQNVLRAINKHNRHSMAVIKEENEANKAGTKIVQNCNKDLNKWNTGRILALSTYDPFNTYPRAFNAGYKDSLNISPNDPYLRDASNPKVGGLTDDYFFRQANPKYVDEQQ